MRKWNAHMLKICFTFSIILSSHTLYAETITLTPKRQLTIEMVNKVASEQASVTLSRSASARQASIQGVADQPRQPSLPGTS